jgi:hypothetical protein
MDMTQDAGQVRVAPHGKILTAVAGTTLPATPTEAWPTGWIDQGYADESGVVITPTLTTVDIRAWQTASPLMVLPTDTGLTFKFVLQQYNAATTSLFFGGAAWVETTTGSGIFKLVLSSTPSVANLMLGIEWGDGIATNKLVVKRGMVTQRDALAIVRNTNQKFGITVTALDASGELAEILSDDVAVTPAA